LAAQGLQQRFHRSFCPSIPKLGLQKLFTGKLFNGTVKIVSLLLFLKSQVNISACHSALDAEFRLCVFLDSRFRGNDKCGAGMTNVARE